MPEAGQPAATFFHTMFTAAARRTPDAAAVTDPARTLSYRELDDVSDRVATRLVELAVGPDVVVAVLMERSVEAVLAVLAVLKAGGAFLPLDPAYPDAQLGRMVETAGAALLITADEAAATRTGGHLPTATVGDLIDSTRSPRNSTGLPRRTPRSPRGDHLAYVTHTSGSIQHPKAVGVSHRSLAVAAQGWLDTYGLREPPVAHLQYAGFSFDVFIQDLARCFLSGGTLVICPPAVRLDPPSLVEFIDTHTIAFAEFTPTLLLLLLEYLELTGRHLPGLRMVAVGGEPWLVDTYNRLARVVPNAVIANTYGLAESTIDNLAHFGPPPPDSAPDQLMPLGRPHPGTDIIVVDVETNAVVESGTGELYLAGPCLSAGYLGQPELTAQRFVAHPQDAAELALRTGDLVRIDPQGTVHYLGRRDDQVKIRGVRVSLGELEATLTSHPAVRRTAVVARPAATGQELIAHVVPAGDAALPEEELRELVRRTLAPEAVPSRIVSRADLPVSANGKIDRARLAERMPARPVTPALGASTAELVSAVWRQVIGSRAPVPGDDFFAMGGDSVAAAHVLTRVGLAGGAQIPAHALHEHPTFGGLVRYLDTLRTPLPPLTGRADPTGHPLSPTQRRLWLHSRTHPDQTTYVVPTIVDLNGRLSHDALSTALQNLVARHEPLRTIIAGTDAEPRCVIRPPRPAPTRTVQAIDEDDARAQTTAFLRQPFALNEQPPIRVQLIALGPRRHWLVLAVHHIATDGESGRIILAELAVLYNAAIDAREAGLTPMVHSYGDVVEWRRAGAAAERPAKPMDHWRRTLANYEDRPLALEGPEPDRATGAGQRHTDWLGSRLTTAVRAAARQHHTTVFVTLLAAFAELVGRWSGSTDVCVGYPVSTRELAPMREMVGLFVDTRAVRVDLSAAPSYSTLIHQVHGEVIGAAAGHGVPVDVAAEAMAGDRGDRGPIFRTWFNHLGGPERPPAMHGLSTALLDPPEPAALYDVNVYIVEHDDDIRIDVVRDRARCSSEAADELLGQYLRLLADAVADTDSPMRRHRPRTRRAVPDPADVLDAPPPPPMARHLARVAAGRGPAIAVRDEHGGYSYQTLRATVRTVARLLRQAGVRPGDVVAVPAQRSALLVPALIGTLAAGGRLLMLDTGHPAARLVDHMATARPRCLMLVGTDSLGQPLVAATSCAVVALTSAGPARVLRQDDPNHTPTNLGGTGYVAFTSGTTGTPAAVTAGLGPIAHFLHWYTARFRIGSADRFALLAGVSHDPLFRDVLTPLWAGALLCVPDADTLRSPAELLAWLHREQITVMHLTPPLARLLLDAAAATPVVLSSLRLVCLAGDLVTSADVTRLSALAANAVLINGYGTTETPQLASWQLLRPGATPALGAGAPGSQLLVVDPEGELCAIGEPGHIVVRSRHLVEGLLNAADRGNTLTPDEVPGVRRFRTGDLGRYQVDGSVAFLGRSDTVVKVRGFRASPAEVDLALADDPRIAASLTTSAAGPDGTELISYVVGGGGPVNVTALRNRLAGLLPAHLLPTTIVLVDRLPLTVNGKVDPAALGRATVVTASGSTLEAPKGPLEWRLARIWTTVLGTERVSVTDSFFDLGGTSLSMIRLHAAICREVHDRLPLLALYQNPSIRALAQYLASGAEQPSRAIRSRQSPAGERSRRLSSRRGSGR